VPPFLAKRLRRRGRAWARQLLDEAYQDYLRDLASAQSSQTRNLQNESYHYSPTNSLATSGPAGLTPQSDPQVDSPSSPVLELPASPRSRVGLENYR